MAIPKLALIPSGVKAGKLYSVLPTNGDGDFTTTRNTVATRVNENGLIEEVASNVPRLDYSDGGCPSLLLEPLATNLILNHTGSSFSAFNGASIVLNDSLSPDGGINSTKVVTSGSPNELVQESGLVIVSGQSYTISGYFKLKSGTLSSTNNDFKGLDGLTGSGLGFSTFNTINNTWQRLSFTATSSTASGRVQLKCEDSAEIIIWGLQVESNSFATSLVKTIGTTQSRSADTANGAGNASTFNDSSGVLMAEVSTKDDGANKFITLSDGTDDNRVTIYFYTSINNDIRFQVRSNNINQPLTPMPSGYNIDEFNKIAIKYKQNDISVYINGFLVVSNVGNIDTPLNLSELAFDDGQGASDFYGNTKQLQYFDSALNDSDLEKLTSWTSFTAMANALKYTII